MSLFQRITTPFGEPAEDDSDRLAMRNAAGELLRERRQQLRLDLDAVAEALCIKPVYLAAIEQGRTEELPGPTYAIGFIRAYANYLGLDGERVLDSYREEKADVQTRPDLTPSGAARRAQRSRRPGAADRPGPGAVRLRRLVLCQRPASASARSVSPRCRPSCSC